MRVAGEKIEEGYILKKKMKYLERILLDHAFSESTLLYTKGKREAIKKFGAVINKQAI